MADFSLKAHDRLPSIAAQFVDASAAPVDLTNAIAVTFIMSTADKKDVRTNSSATVVDAPTGKVRYDWQTVDTATPGDYLAEWQVTWLGGLKQTFPSESYNTVSIIADLDNA